MKHLWPALVLLMGCPWVGSQTYDDRVRDADDDGGISVRFGGKDCEDGDPAIVDCDADNDGHRSAIAGGDDCDDTRGDVHPEAPELCDSRDNDCDGAIDNDDPEVNTDSTFFIDADGDGAGDPDQARACQEYTDPTNPSTGSTAPKVPTATTPIRA